MGKIHEESAPDPKLKDWKRLTQAEIGAVQELSLVIKQLRINTGLSQEKFAIKKQFPRTWYGDIERGNGNITYSTLIRICKAHKITILKFFEQFDQVLAQAKKNL